MNLAWKEFRESLPLALMTLGLIIVYALWPLYAGGMDRIDLGQWQYGLFGSGIVVLFFVAMVLGVGAYATEEEEETLLPLLAKPMSESQVLWIKVIARLGTMFLLSLVFAGILMLTGAWQAPWNPGSLQGLTRWIGGLALQFLGFSLGLYFGRTRKRQTEALVGAMLTFGAGWVVLTFTPINVIFLNWQGDFEPVAYGIMLPLLFGVIVFSLARRPEWQARRRIPSGAVVAGALALYAVLLVASAVILFRRGEVHLPGDYASYATLRLGSPGTVLEELEDRFQQGDAGWVSTPESLFQLAVDRNLMRSLQMRGDSLLEPHEFTPGQTLPLRMGAPAPMAPSEAFVIKHRSSAWIGELIEHAREAEVTSYQRIIVIHLAAVANRAEHTDAVARFLEDNDPLVRAAASVALLVRNDGRGGTGLVEAMEQLSTRPMSSIARVIQFVDLGPEVNATMRTWLTSAASLRRRAARLHFARHGDGSIVSELQRSLWLDLRRSERETTDPASIDIQEYEIAWATRNADIAQLRREAEQSVAWMREQGYERGPFGSRLEARRRRYGRSGADRYGREGALLREYIFRLAELRDPELPAFWWENRAYTRGVGDSRYGSPSWDWDQQFLPTLAAVGEAGYPYLQRIADGEGEADYLRFQAAALLVHYGASTDLERVVDRWYIPGAAVSYGSWWMNSSIEVLEALAMEGHARAAGFLIENARGRLDSGLQQYDLVSPSRDVAGTWFWNTRIVRTLENATGERYGWDLDAWSRWWRRAQQGTSTAAGIAAALSSSAVGAARESAATAGPVTGG